MDEGPQEVAAVRRVRTAEVFGVGRLAVAVRVGPRRRVHVRVRRLFGDEALRDEPAVRHGHGRRGDLLRRVGLRGRLGREAQRKVLVGRRARAVCGDEREDHARAVVAIGDAAAVHRHREAPAAEREDRHGLVRDEREVARARLKARHVLRAGHEEDVVAARAFAVEALLHGGRRLREGRHGADLGQGPRRLRGFRPGDRFGQDGEGDRRQRCVADGCAVARVGEVRAGVAEDEPERAARSGDGGERDGHVLERRLVRAVRDGPERVRLARGRREDDGEDVRRG